ncbi:hypothetical protein GA0061091_11258 [Gordonia sp. v-85]|nr:hypothetical protein GA0061091_11258 [Gordonia sp. v-85]
MALVRGGMALLRGRDGARPGAGWRSSGGGMALVRGGMVLLSSESGAGQAGLLCSGRGSIPTLRHAS